MTTITTSGYKDGVWQVLATREAQRRFVRWHNGEYTTGDGIKVAGRLGRERMDAEMAAKGFKRTTGQPDETGEYVFEEDPVLIQQAAQQKRLDQAVEDWNLHGVHGGRPLPKPTLADVAAGPWKPPVPPEPPPETPEERIDRLEAQLANRHPYPIQPR